MKGEGHAGILEFKTGWVRCRRKLSEHLDEKRKIEIFL